MQRRRPSITVLRSEEKGSIIAPVSRAGKLRNRHQLNRGDAEVDEFRQMTNQGVKSSLTSVSPDMKFIKDALLQLSADPFAVGPLEIGCVYELGGAMHTLWLITG